MALARATAVVLLTVALAFGLNLPPQSHAQSATEGEIAETAQQLESVQDQLEREREILGEIESEIDRIRGDQDELNERLIATAATVQDHESAIIDAEDKLAGFSFREDTVRGRLSGRRDTLATLLGALQQMSHKQPPAIVVSPQDALRSVRSAMLVGAVVPEIRTETEALTRDLEELVALRQGAEQEREARATALASLSEERIRLNALMQAKVESALEARERLQAARTRADQLATESDNLEQLLSALRSRATEPVEPDAPPPPSSRDIPEDERLQPASRFASLRGTLNYPVAGAVLRQFGSPDEFGGRISGLELASRPEAQVTAPTDGTIVYSGPFRNFGELLIIDVGDDYHIVLAGLGAIDVEVGQVVLAGEPIGRMGTIAFASAQNRPDTSNRPILYIEFRKGGSAVDPSPWWSANQTGVEG